MQSRRDGRLAAALCAGLLLVGVAACSSSSDDQADDGGAAAGATTSPSGSGDPGGGAGSGGGGTGTLTLGDETIQLGSPRCYLEEQPAAAGGGTIELTAQASGTNAAGQPVSMDFSRYSTDSQFAGDDLNITIGDPGAPDAMNLSGSLDHGAVTQDGSSLSGTGFMLLDDSGAQQSASFELSC
jgi:hypothetical protein